MHFTISNETIDLSTIQHVLDHTIDTISIDEKLLHKIDASYSFIKQKVSDGEELYYGINTGFGSLCNVAINKNDLEELQYNLIRSHACGTGDPVPVALSRLILFLKIVNLSQGFSGVSQTLLETMISVYNVGIVPCIYELGSLGASGDLAPLAHLALTLIGEGKVWYKGEIMPSAEALQKHDISPHRLKPKEGLALINGTQFCSAYMAYAVIHAQHLLHLANRVGSMSVEAYMCDLAPFEPLSHKIRKQQGQQLMAAEIYASLKDSHLLQKEKVSVQDPYSFRCIPQVHGATWSAIAHADSIISQEINAVTDNPNVFAEEDRIISAGNFHAQPLAMVMDYLAIALSELGSISERRTYKLINGDRGLPTYLTTDPGKSSGFMIAQYTAASIVSQNKQLSTPASVDSIVSSMGQEDHVSMGANAATKLYRVVENIYRLISIETMVSAQALEFRDSQSIAKANLSLLGEYRNVVSSLIKDRVLHDDIEAGIPFLKQLPLLKYTENIT